MKPKMSYKVVLVAICLLSSCLVSAPALAVTDFSDTSLWTVVTEGTGFNAAPNANQLVLTIPTNTTGRAGVVSNFTVSGNFDMQVNYSLNTWPTNNQIELSLEFSQSNGDLIAGIGRTDLGGNFYGSEIIYPNNDILNTVGTTDTSGQLRINRTGNTITCYYWDGTWETLALATDPALGQNGIIDLRGSETLTPNVGTATVTFSDLSLVANPNAVPIPPSLLLLGAGLLGLGLPGLRRRIKKG